MRREFSYTYLVSVTNKLLRNLSELLDALDSNHRLLKTNEAANHPDEL